MTIFDRYAQCYDLLYNDKDYKGEAAFVHDLLKKHAPGAKTLLDIGCGTGTHAANMAGRGFDVTGIDSSEKMLAVARERKKHGPTDTVDRLRFQNGDARQLRLNRQFDAVVSLFHVMCYQTTNDDFKAAITSVDLHLKPGGVFIFDFWYGPAVLYDLPSIRVKRKENENISVTRIAEPEIYPNDNRVAVHYTVFLKDKKSGVIEELNERHDVRYFFKPDIDALFAGTSFKQVEFGEWMTGKTPNFNSWGTYCILTKP